MAAASSLSPAPSLSRLTEPAGQAHGRRARASCRSRANCKRFPHLRVPGSVQPPGARSLRRRQRRIPLICTGTEVEYSNSSLTRNSQRWKVHNRPTRKTLRPSSSCGWSHEWPSWLLCYSRAAVSTPSAIARAERAGADVAVCRACRTLLWSPDVLAPIGHDTRRKPSAAGAILCAQARLPVRARPICAREVTPPMSSPPAAPRSAPRRRGGQRPMFSSRG